MHDFFVIAALACINSLANALAKAIACIKRKVLVGSHLKGELIHIILIRRFLHLIPLC